MREAVAARPALAAALILALAPPLWAQGDVGIRRPEQLTVGVSDEFLGQLSADGKMLYFLSNRNTLHEVYQQEVESARVLQLFDEGADVTWARLSPDGRSLLYISYREEAAGQLCVRELPRGGLPPRGQGGRPVITSDARRCLEDGSRAVQAQWLSPTEIALVSRPSLQGDLRLSRVTLGRRLVAQPLLERNLTNPTLSPDGRWLVYVPVERYIAGVGPGFAARAARRLEAVRLRDGRPLGAPQVLALDLPGWTGQPAFAADGRSLYFAQFFNDSNHDGNIDGSDHAVLFRVPFPGERDDAPQLASRAFPEQLTDSAWNCQYPAPARGRLVATCTRSTNLDIYALPLDGVVPGDWDGERLRLEIDLGTRRADLLLLYRHLLARERDPVRRDREMTRLIVLHQEQDEFEAAEFYARKLEGTKDPVLEGLSPVLVAQVAHHRAARRRERGRAGSFREEARQRLAALSAEGPGSPSARALRRVLRAEMHDALGDKDAARREIAAVAVDEIALPAVLDALHNAADALYRGLDDGPALWALTRRLASHPNLGEEERLRYARAAVRGLIRGLPYDEAEALLARHRAEAAPAEGELAFALELAQATLGVRGARPPAAVTEALVALYRRQARPDRRQALMVDVGQRANAHGAQAVTEALVQLYVDDVPRGTRERRRAERLYRRFMEGRAYGELAAGQRAAARDTFARVARATGSLESHVEYINLRLQEGKSHAAIRAEYEAPGAGHSDAVARFVRAYLMALELPQVADHRYLAASREAARMLRDAWPAFHNEPTARVLLGSLLHERFLRTRDRQWAQRADVHYQVALGLVNRNPRYRALVLEQLGLLQAQVGNYRIALGYLTDREKLPFPEGANLAGRLVHLVVKAQTLLHLSEEDDAASAADEALALAQATPALSGYLPLVLDRAALYNLAAGRFARALAHYDALLPLLPDLGDVKDPKDVPPQEAPAADAEDGATAEGGVATASPAALAGRNRLLVRLARAAAALGAQQPKRALVDLAVVEGLLGAQGDPRLHAALAWPHTPVPDTLRAYRQISAGLRARAHRALGQAQEAVEALSRQQALLLERFTKTQLDEHLRPLALAEAQLAESAAARGDAAGAGRWLRRALADAGALARRAKVAVGSEELTVLWLAAELRAGMHDALGLDVAGPLREVRGRLLTLPEPTAAQRSDARLLEIYEALLARGARRP